MSKHTLSSIICSDYLDSAFTIIISNDNNVYSFGYSKFSGFGHEESLITSPKQITTLQSIKQAICFVNNSYYLDYNGNVFSLGENDKGQLGIGKTKEELHFTHIPQQITLTSIKQISCGQRFVICLSEDGLLYAFGENNYGQLGFGDNREYNLSPELIPDLKNIEFIQCGITYVICKTYDNIFYSWGFNYHGQLGHGNTCLSCKKPIQCLNWPDNIITFKCGAVHTLLLTLEGQVYSFGRNNFGQLGVSKDIQSLDVPTLIGDIPEIQRIECGYGTSMCIDYDNNLWLWGFNKYGILGLGDIEDKDTPIKHPILENIIDISSGGLHTYVKTNDNEIYAFGYNKYSQLGIDTSEQPQVTPIQVFKDNADIWNSSIGKSRAKSARK